MRSRGERAAWGSCVVRCAHVSRARHVTQGALVTALLALQSLSACVPAPHPVTQTPPSAVGSRPVSSPAAGAATPPSATAAGAAPVAPADSLLGVWMPALSSPRLDSLGHLDWSPRPRWSAEAAHARAVLRDAADSLAGWRSLAAESSSVLRPYALRRVAREWLARGDTAAADRTLSESVAVPSPWRWEALRLRCDLALRAGRPSFAESLLDVSRHERWTALDLSSLLIRQAALAEARGDSAQASARAHEVLDGFPATPASTAAIALLERFATARSQPLTNVDARQAAESARLRGDRAAAIDWLERTHRAATGAMRARIAVPWARALREARRFDAAFAVLTIALRDRPSAALAAELRLERGRCLLDVGRTPEALGTYAALERDSLAAELAAVAGWEHGRALIAAGRSAEARDVLRRVARLGGEHSGDAWLLCGLLWLADGESTRAVLEWERAVPQGEATQFWRAVLGLRSPDMTARDSARATLEKLAAAPGYSFYSVAARETLGVKVGVRTAALRDSCGASPPELRLAETLFVIGDAEAAMLVMQRWRAEFIDASAHAQGARAAGCRAASLSDAAELAYGMNHMPLGIRLAQNALEASSRAKSQPREELLAALRYPAAFDTLYRALPESVVVDPLDTALLRAVAWQESHFDPRARSKSDALGLYQFKLATAADVAHRLGDGPPDREGMFDPARSLRYGREYLRWLLARFDRQWLVAISAYNSGPTPVSPRWQVLLDRGGMALFCELINRAETRDYVRNIMGAREAYRDLRPYVIPAHAVPGRP